MPLEPGVQAGTVAIFKGKTHGKGVRALTETEEEQEQKTSSSVLVTTQPWAQ